MKKRIFASLLVATMLFTGCQGKTEVTPASTEASVSVSVEEVTEEVKEEVAEEVVEEVSDAETKPEATWLDTSKSIEERIELLMNEMTLEEKAFQMVQPEQVEVSLEDITKYGIGSILSGGGSLPPTGNTAKDWNEHINSMKQASLESRLGIPLIYGVDAVHGHNNVYGATVFPHNIGLGAAEDEELMYEIGRVTAEEVKATGIQWDFAPCLGNPQDVTWGRTYECFGENTDIIVKLTDDYIKGLQENGIVACAKHYIGEGYTENGVNQGDVKMSDEEFDALLSMGVLDPYSGAVNAGVLTVMPSYSSVNGVKCHANYHLLTEVLKEQLGFKGFVISDYNAIEQIEVPGGLKGQVEASVNAGVDMLMEPSRWKESAELIVALVNEGKITEERLNDAVYRILYVKFTAGLFEDVIGDEDEYLEKFGSEEHREVARRAVRESQVLLKNENDALARLKDATFITVEGDAAYNMGRQCGGWTITWQGQSGNITLGTSIIDGIYNTVKDNGVTVKHDKKGNPSEETDAIIAVFGEVPYAESDGDRNEVVNMAANDAKMLDALKENIAGKDIPVIGIIVAGRPIDISEYEDMFDAIVFAGLPGTEGMGIADVLFGEYEFTGTLKYTWR